MRQAIVALPCLFALTAAQAQAPVPDGAMKAVTTYSKAFLRADCEGIRALSALIHRHPEAQALVCENVATWIQEGMHERLRLPTSSLSSGRYRMVVVPVTRIQISEGAPNFTEGAYVAASADAGGHWEILDLAVGCPHLADWLKDLYPPYEGQPLAQLAALELPPDD